MTPQTSDHVLARGRVWRHLTKVATWQRWWISATVLIIFVAGAGGCATVYWSLEAGRAEYLQKHPETFPELVEAIRAGRLEVGMTPGMVTVTYGPPGLPFLWRKGNPRTSGAWGYFLPDPVSKVRSLASSGLTPMVGAMTIVYFRDNAVTHWETHQNVSQDAFPSLARLD